MNEEIFEKLEQLLSENERKLDNLIEAQRERKTISETKKEVKDVDVSDADIRKIVDKLEI
jgi:hypothetical protein